jgi:hypothetical protein
VPIFVECQIVHISKLFKVCNNQQRFEGHKGSVKIINITNVSYKIEEEVKCEHCFGIN